MKISTKGRYGLRTMVDLAINSKGTHVSLQSIAERQNISMNYLEQVFSTLRKSGLVKSVKGAQGGYSLTKAPGEILIGEILRALEGELLVIDEEKELEGAMKNSIQYCIKDILWDELNKKINEVVDSLTLQVLIDEYNLRNSGDSLMFYI